MLLVAAATPELSAQSAGSAGAFSRLGFGARGMGMGNAASALRTGQVASYYNPALSPFATERFASATFGLLSLGRTLDFVSYTMALPPNAGISVGLIHAGVADIDGRDFDGVHTEDYSTSENQFYLSFANRVDERVSLGVTIKLLYAKLFDEVTSTTVGFDAGALVGVTDQLSVGIVLQDLNAKYKWDTKALYGQSGRVTEDRFPTLRRIAVSYELPEGTGVVDLEFENSSERTNMIRFGAEYGLTPELSVRAGADRYEFGDDATGVKPTFGFTLRNSFNGWTPSVHYAFVVEGYAPRGMHVVTVSAAF